MFAVVNTGGKQYKVSKGDILEIEKIEGEEGSQIELAPVLMTGGGGSTEIGTPALEGKKVTAKIVAQVKAPKVVILKHRPRQQASRRKQGHRQRLTRVEIVSID